MANQIFRTNEYVSQIAVQDKEFHAESKNQPDKSFSNNVSSQQDIFEKTADPGEYVCDCYPNYNVVKGMPKSVFGDSFGWKMSNDIFACMKEYYEGKIDQEELKNCFESYCSSMLTYRTQQCQTSGNNAEDNKKILEEMYEFFAKNSARAANGVNYLEGKKLNETAYPNHRNDNWVYYNSDYYYKCEETKDILRQTAEKMTEKWGTDPIDPEEIERKSSLKLDGALDFNSVWNFYFRNQAGRGSIGEEALAPPEGLTIFYKENIYPNAKDADTAFKGILKITMGEEFYEEEVPFSSRYVNMEGQIFRADKLMEKHFAKSQNSVLEKFLKNFWIFTRIYSSASGINNYSGDYTPRV